MPREQIENALKKHGARVLHLAYSYLRRTADAEDILQDTMLIYLQKAPVFESEEHEKAWLLRVAANLCKNRLRSPWSRMSEIPEDYPGEGIPEESLALYESVNALPEKYREVIHLFYYEDFFTAQIAYILGKKESTVRSLLFRARALLREQLTTKGYNHEEI